MTAIVNQYTWCIGVKSSHAFTQYFDKSVVIFKRKCVKVVNGEHKLRVVNSVWRNIEIPRCVPLWSIFIHLQGTKTKRQGGNTVIDKDSYVSCNLRFE